MLQRMLRKKKTQWYAAEKVKTKSTFAETQLEVTLGLPVVH